MQNQTYHNEQRLAVIGCGNREQNVDEGPVSAAEVTMGCLLLRLQLDESKEMGLFLKAGINNWKRGAKESRGSGKHHVMLFLMLQSACCVSKLL